MAGQEFLITLARFGRAAAELFSIGFKTRQSRKIFTRAAEAAAGSSASYTVARATEQLAGMVGPQAGKYIGDAVASLSRSSFSVGGKTIPLLAVAIITAAALFRISKYALRRQWKLASAELGVSAVEAAINIACLSVPVAGLILGEAWRQGVVEVLDRKFDCRPDNSGIYDLCKLGHSGIKKYRERRQRKLGAGTPLPPMQTPTANFASFIAYWP